MADDYSPITTLPAKEFVTLEEKARREKARIARETEIEKRRKALVERGKHEASAKEKTKPQYNWEPQPPRPMPKTVMVDGVDTPIDKEIARIPEQLDFEERVLSSPLRERALRRRRIEDLVGEGKSQAEAEQTAIKEQEGRASAFKLGQETIRNSPSYQDKESRALGSGVSNSIISMGARALGMKQTADEAEAASAGLQSEMGRVREEQHPYPKIQGALAGAASSAVQMLPGMISSPITGPGVGMAVMAGQYGSQEYSRAAYEGAEAGLAGKELDRYAMVQGGIEGSIMPIFSKIPGLAGLEGRVLRQSIARGVANHPAVRKAIASGVKLTKDTGAELAEEVTTEVLHGLATENMLSQDVDYKAIVGDTVLQTLVMMAGAEAGQQVGSLAFRSGDPLGMRKPVPPAVEKFTEKPSETNYDAAVKAGMPPIDKPNRAARAKYAADLLKDPFGMRKPDPRMDTVPNEQPPARTQADPATDDRTTPFPPESSPATVPDDEYDQFIDQFIQKGEPNAPQIEASTEEPEAAQGQAERILNDAPAGTQDAVRPPDSADWKSQRFQEMQDKAAKLPKAEFENAYRDSFTQMMKYTPDQAGSSIYAEELAAMSDAHPDWVDEIEKAPAKEASPVATGEPSPDQSPESAGPVSPPEPAETAPSQSSPETSPPAPSTQSAKLAKDKDAARRVLAKLKRVSTDRGWPEGKIRVAKPDIEKAVKGTSLDIHILKTGLLDVEVQDMGDGTFHVHDRTQPASPEPAPIEPVSLPEPSAPQLTVTPTNSQQLTAPAISPPVKQFAALPQKSQDLFNKAFESKDIESLKQMVAKNNVAWNSEFQNRTGIKLPTTVKGRHQAVLDWAANPPKKPATAKPLKPTGPEKGRSLRSIVLAQGGISAKSLRKDYNSKDLKADGLLGVMRISGQPLDEIAQVLVSSGDLRVPENRTPSDWLIEQLKLNADGARAEYSDAEIGKQLEAEREAYERVKEYEADEKAALDELRRSSEAEGIRAANAEESGDEISAAESEIIDTSFDFGANVEAKADEDAFTLKRPEKPKPRAEDFGTNPNSKQGGLFDAGKKGDLKGQELLFNSDAGDLQNPKTQENKAKAAESKVSNDASEMAPDNGSRFTHDGQEYEVWKSRHGVTEAHPVENGKPVVNKQTTKRFASNEMSAQRNPELPRLNAKETTDDESKTPVSPKEPEAGEPTDERPVSAGTETEIVESLEDRVASLPPEVAEAIGDALEQQAAMLNDDLTAGESRELARITKLLTKKMEDFGEHIPGARKEGAKKTGPRSSKPVPEGETKKPTWMKPYEVSRIMKSSDKSEEGKWSITSQKQKDWMGQAKQLGVFDTEAEAEKAVPLLALAQQHRIKTMPDGTYAIIRDLAKGKYPVVKGGFETENDAKKYMVQNPEKIIEHKFPRYESLQYLERVQRDGEDHRKGKDIRPEDFKKEFNLRGGQFGNWQSGKDGQISLNHAFDSFHDLADTLGLDKGAITLDGKLAMAFGARGTGGENAARAHYEPGERVINLTKMAGAGTLAHEWAHAMDHMVAGLTQEKNGSSAVAMQSYSLKKHARPELAEAVTNLYNTMMAHTTEEAIQAPANKYQEKKDAKNKENREKSRENNIEMAFPETLDDHLWNVKKNLESMARYKKKTLKPEQVKEFDELSAKIAGGDAGKGIIAGGGQGIGGRWSFENLEKLNDLHKKMVGRGFHTNDDHSLGTKVYHKIDSERRVAERVKQAEAGQTEKRKKRTNFLNEAVELDKQRVGDYYTKPEEMMARAFEGYIADKLEASGKRSDYLIGKGKTENERYRRAEIGAPFPEGDERIRINAAFDKLFDTLRGNELQAAPSSPKQTVEPADGGVTPSPAAPVEETGESKPVAEAPVESELRKSAREAKEAVDAQKAENARLNKIIIKDLQDPTKLASGAVISDELAKAIAGRMLGEIRLGVKRFDLLIKNLRADFDDSIVQTLKPRFIAMWNAVRDKYGLEDEATEAVFDAAMSDTVDVDIEQLAEAAKAATAPGTDSGQTRDELGTDGDNKTYSTKNAFTDAERPALDMPERPKAETLPRAPSIERAAELGKTEYGRKETDRLIQELQATRRAADPFENDMLLYRKVELNKKLDSALRAKNAAAKSGDDVQNAVNDQEALNLKTQLQQMIELLSDPLSKAAGRNLQARKAVVDEDFTLVRQVLEFEAAHGRAPDTEGHTGELAAMQADVDALSAKVEELNKLLAEADAKAEDLQAKLKEAHDNLVNKATPPEAPAPKPAKAPPVEKTESAARKAALAEIADGVKMFRDMFKSGMPFSALGPLDPFLKIASGYSKLGVITLKEFLTRAARSLGTEAKNYTAELTAAWKQVRGAAGQTDISSVTDKIDPMDPDTIGRAARNLHAFVIERDGLDASPEGREAAVAAVHSILVDFVPGLTIDDTARAMSGIGIYSELSDNEIDVIRRDQKAQLLLLEQIGDWKKGTPPPATGQERPPVSDEQRALRKMVNDAKKASGISTTTEGQLRSALDAAKRMATNRIADLTKAIETGKRIAKNQKLLQPDAELTALQESRDALQKLYDEAFGKPELTDEQRLNLAEKALDRAITDLESDLKAGKLYSDAPKPRMTSPAIEAKRAALDALKANREELRLQSGEAQARSDAAYERLLTERDAELARRLAEKDFMPAAKKPERKLTPAMMGKMRSIDEKQKALLKQRKKWIFDNKNIIYKAFMKGPVAILDVHRMMMLSFEMSLIGRQGRLLGGSHPLIYLKAISKAFASNLWEAKSIFPTKQDLFNTQAKLNADAKWVRLEKIAKLAVTNVEGGANAEEGTQHVPDWIHDVPGFGGAERSGSAFINTQRRLVFRTLVEKLAAKHERNGAHAMSNSELRVIGNAVNVPSGRADLGRWMNSLEGLSRVFLAPRWVASRVLWWLGEPIWHEAKWRGGEGASTEVRKLVAVEWAKQAAAQATFIGFVVGTLYAMLGPPGDDEEWDFYWDPRSKHFGHIRHGSNYQDMTAGLAQHLSALVRILTSTQINRWETVETDKGRVAGSYLQGKLAPVPSMVGDYVFGSMNPNLEFGSKEWFARKVVPLMPQDTYDAIKGEGIVLGPVFTLLAFFGQNSRTLEARVKERSDVANELRALNKQGKQPEKIQTILNDHLKHAASVEAKSKLRTSDPEEQAGYQKVVAGEDSPELTEAIEKEKYDIILNASARVSTDKRRISNDEKMDFSGSDDKGRLTARSLVPIMVPDVDDAIKLYNAAYRARNNSLLEKNGQIKASVWAGRARIRQLYKQQQ